jgi:AraC family transcriptional regulator of arabinose operon
MAQTLYLSVDRRIENAIRTLEGEFTQHFTLEILAKSVNLSVSRFRHLFKQELGLAPMKYLRYARIRRAQTLLQVTTMAIKSIAREVGYHDDSQFFRDFQRATGLSPARFRNDLRPNASCKRGENDRNQQ